MRGIDVVIAEMLVLIMVTVITVGSYFFLKKTVSGGIRVTEKTTEKTVEAVTENVEITGVRRNKVTVVNHGDETEIKRIYIDNEPVNYSPSTLSAGSVVDVQLEKIVNDPYSKVKLGNKLIIITKTGNKYEYSIPGDYVVDEILTLDDFDIVNGTWTQNEMIEGSIS